jgi:hypothetical protein
MLLSWAGVELSCCWVELLLSWEFSIHRQRHSLYAARALLSCSLYAEKERDVHYELHTISQV